MTLAPRPRQGTISVVIAVRNEEATLPELYRRLSRVLDQIGLEWEIVLVEDSSTDRTVEIARDLAARDARLKVVLLTRSFGHHVAVTAGLDYAQGDHIILMDGDLQHRPEDIPKLLEVYFRGFDVVYGKRTTRQPFMKELGSRAINALVNRLSDSPTDLNSSMFRVISAKVKHELHGMRERSRFLVGMIGWLGFRSAEVSIEESARHHGKSKYDLGRMVDLSVNYLTSVSTRPLRLAIYLGLVTALLSAVSAFVYLVQAAFFGATVSGFPTLIITLSMLGGIQLFVLGIIGEYLGKMFIEIQGRQMYVVKATMNLEARASEVDHYRKQGNPKGANFPVG